MAKNTKKNAKGKAKGRVKVGKLKEAPEELTAGGMKAVTGGTATTARQLKLRSGAKALSMAISANFAIDIGATDETQ